MTTPAAPFREGPFLIAALICEKLLTERDGVTSAIRIIDRLTHYEVGPNPPATMPAFNWKGSLLILFKSGRARGPMTLRVPLEKPNGTRVAGLPNVINFEGEDDRGVELKTDIEIRLDMPGLYWFHVTLDDVELTRMPLRVFYQPKVIRIP
ncbi:MAG: hypothetical protein AB1597_01660 [Chloroflexota bacterium]